MDIKCIKIYSIYVLEIYISSSTGCSTTSALGPRPISQSTNHGAQLSSTKLVRYCWKQPQCYLCNCSLSLTLAGHHVGGQGKWGNCGPGCPIPPGIQSSELCGDNGSCSNSTRHLNIPLIFPVTISIYMIIWFSQMIGCLLPHCLLPKKVGDERKTSQPNSLISSSDFWQLGKTWLMTCSLTSAK